MGACQSSGPNQKFESFESLLDGPTGTYTKQSQDVLDEIATLIDQTPQEEQKIYLLGEYAKLSYKAEDWDRLFGIFYVCAGCSEVADRLHSLALLKFCYTKKAQSVTQDLVNKNDPYGKALNSLVSLSSKYIPPTAKKADIAKVEGSRIRKWPLLGTSKAPLRFIRVRTQNLCELQKAAVNL
jgi:hypothetical protein